MELASLARSSHQGRWRGGVWCISTKGTREDEVVWAISPMSQETDSFSWALVFVGHPLMGGSVDLYGAMAGIYVGREAGELEERMSGLLAASPVKIASLGRDLMYVPWPEIWLEEDPLPPIQEPLELVSQLVLPLIPAIGRPVLVSRLGRTPAALRGRLEFQPETVLRFGGPLDPVRVSEQLTREPPWIASVLEYRGEVWTADCRLGLLKSFGITVESLATASAVVGGDRPGRCRLSDPGGPAGFAGEP